MKPLDRVLSVTAALFGIGAFLSALRLASNPKGAAARLGAACRHRLPDCWLPHGLARHLARTLALGRPHDGL
jgi:hypothetical protein